MTQPTPATAFDRRRLVVRMFLYGIVILVTTSLSVALLVRLLIEPKVKRDAGGFAWVAVTMLAHDIDDPSRLARKCELLRAESHTKLTLFRPDGVVIASTLDTPQMARSSSELASLVPGRAFPLPSPGPPIFAVGVYDAEGRLTAYGVHEFPSLPPAPRERIGIALLIVLVVLALVSLPLTRSLLVPLAKIHGAARAFGEGDMSARTGLHRSDELGELAVAFDDMADRIATLRRSEKELLANVSHELRTPIARIRVVLELASDSSPDETRQYLGEITEDLGELEQLVEDVLQTTRLELHSDGVPSSIPTLRLEPVPVDRILERSAALFRSRAAERVLDVSLPESSPEVRVDPILLRRAIDNLLENARKYSEPTTPIALRLGVRDSTVVISVEDHGIGIDPEDQSRVFTPFFRTERSRARTMGGVGLGLTLVQKVVTAHHGTISIRSARGEGTTVEIELPIFVE